MNNLRPVYFDNAATTPLRKEVRDTIIDFMDEYGNPSSNHYLGSTVKERIENIRTSYKKYFRCEKEDRLIFTGCGTESNNIAIKGFLLNNRYRNPHIITSVVEHPSVLNTFKYLETIGYEVTYIPVDENGIVRVDVLKSAIKDNTVLISIMYVNNETGSIQPIAEIGKIAKLHNIKLHIDAVQAFGKIPINIHELNIDMLSFSGHKVYAPKGIGGLIIRNDTKINPILHGGGQEYGIRAGTENSLGIIALGKALEVIKDSLVREQQNAMLIKNLLLEKLSTIPDIRINGDPALTIPNIINVSFIGVEAEAILVSLDMEGIFVAKGSACSSNLIKPSYVLTNMGIPTEIALGSIRFSFGAFNDLEDVEVLMKRLPSIVERARRISLYY